MRQQSDNGKPWVIIAIAVVAVIVAAVVIWPHLRGPVALPPAEMPEAPLPSDPREAEIVIRERAFKDKLAGVDEESCRKRHGERMKQLEEIKRQAERGDSHLR